MNKHRRHELKMLRYKRRLKNYCLKEGEGKFYAFRSHGKPCSCAVCNQPEGEYNRARVKQSLSKEVTVHGWINGGYWITVHDPFDPHNFRVA